MISELDSAFESFRIAGFELNPQYRRTINNALFPDTKVYEVRKPVPERECDICVLIYDNSSVDDLPYILPLVYFELVAYFSIFHDDIEKVVNVTTIVESPEEAIATWHHLSRAIDFANQIVVE
jgi:hypothetical protein